MNSFYWKLRSHAEMFCKSIFSNPFLLCQLHEIGMPEIRCYLPLSCLPPSLSALRGNTIIFSSAYLDFGMQIFSMQFTLKHKWLKSLPGSDWKWARVHHSVAMRMRFFSDTPSQSYPAEPFKVGLVLSYRNLAQLGMLIIHEYIYKAPWGEKLFGLWKCPVAGIILCCWRNCTNMPLFPDPLALLVHQIKQ